LPIRLYVNKRLMTWYLEIYLLWIKLHGWRSSDMLRSVQFYSRNEDTNYICHTCGVHLCIGNCFSHHHA
jgi:hypothetical protein